MKRLSFLLVAFLSLPVSGAFAEVCAVFDHLSVFDHLGVKTEPSKGVIWSKLTAVPDVLCLNIIGDTLGDRSPTHTVILMPDEPLYRGRSPRGFRPGTPSMEIPPEEGLSNPIVVWPRFDGHDWELLYSMWDYTFNGWAYPHFVERMDNSADDLSPLLVVANGKLELTWTRQGVKVEMMGSIGSVIQVGERYDIEWSPAFLVSEGPELTSASREVPIGASSTN